MKQIITFLTVSLIALVSTAQISIDSNDIGSIGDSIVYITDTNVVGINTTPPSGSFQTFNYTTLGVTDISNINFLDPATTPSAGFFPDANLVLAITGNNLIYTVKSDSAFKIDGIYGDILGQGFSSPIDLKPNLALMKFPFNYQDSFQETGIVDTIVEDTFSGFFDSLRLVRVMNIISVADAYGELQLPTLTDTVLRKYDVEVTIDSLYGQVLGIWQQVSVTVETKYYYRFIAKGKQYYLLEAEADSNGVVINAQYQTGGALIAGIINYKHISCNGLTNGKAKAEAVGGVPPYSYLWDNASSSTTQQINGLPAGTYNVTVTDDVNATSIAQVTIIEPDTITIVSTQIGDDNGISDGFIKIAVSGGTPNYSFVWSNGSTAQNLNSLDFGDYTVTVTDSRGCKNEATFTVDKATSVQEIAKSDVINVFPNPTNGEINIQTNENWNLKIYTLIGSQVLVQSGTGNAVLNISNQPAGMYVIEFTINNQIYMGKLQVVK